MPDLVIDLSHWNTVTDFAAIRASGVVGVIHKCTEGNGYADPTYDDRTDAARAAGLLWGAYHFLRPGDMQAQAKYFVAHADDTATLLAADHEDSGVSLDDLKTFLSEVYDLTGQRPVVYSGNVIKEQIGNARDAELAQYRLWLAQYTSVPSWPSETWPLWWLWQHTDNGSVPGVNGGVDMDSFNGNAAQLTSEWLGSPPEPVPPEPETQTVTITITMPKGATVEVS